MMVYIYAPDGSCVVWGGWNVNPWWMHGFGYRNGRSLANHLELTANGNYTATIDVSAGALSGPGD